jgi:formate hydrogenlyase subunit 6/NADH:ubiquinone oxidoreductase subunit I
LCVKDCPAQALELITLDKKAKRFVMRYHVDRCTFCAQCVESCRFNCIGLKNDQWELASNDRGDFTIMYGRPEDVENVKLVDLAKKKEYVGVADTAGE